MRIFPKNEDLKRKLRMNLVITATITDHEKASFIKCQEKDLLKCRACQSYLSHYSTIVDGEWQCQVCDNINNVTNLEIAQDQLKNPSFRIDIHKQTDIGVVRAIYFSLGFKEDEFRKAQLSCISLLRHLSSTDHCLLFIGTDSSPFAIVAPPPTKIFKVSQPAFSFPSILNVNSAMPGWKASIVRFTSIEGLIGLDLSSFFITQENSAAVERTIELLAPSPDKKSTYKAFEMAGTLATVLSGLPLHFLTIANDMQKFPQIFQGIYGCLVRTDFLLPELSKNAIKSQSLIQGLVMRISSENPAKQAAHLLGQKSVYKVMSICHARRCGIEWKKTFKPYSDIKDQKLFVPVCISKNQAFPIEIQPLPNQPYYVFQFITKYLFYEKLDVHIVLQVDTIKFGSSDNIDALINSINWNCVLWWWLHKIIDKSSKEIIASIYRAAAAIIASYGDKINDTLQYLVCLLPDLYMLNDQGDKSSSYIDYLMVETPENLHLKPQMYEIESLKICESPNGISANPSNQEVKKLQSNYPIYLPIIDHIPQSFISSPHERLTTLRGLIEQLK